MKTYTSILFTICKEIQKKHYFSPHLNLVISICRKFAAF